MSSWSSHTGTAACLLLDNIDTDQLIPARFMSRPRADGYGDYLLHDLRRLASGQPDPDFVLDRHPTASILVVGRNFGCGSSREAAVYALVDAGFCAVVSTGFGDIFAANAVNNGLLPAQLTDESIGLLIELADEQALQIGIDIHSRRIACGEFSLPFELDETWQKKLINGWDDIDLTLLHKTKIAAYREQRQQLGNWLQPPLSPPHQSRKMT